MLSSRDGSLQIVVRRHQGGQESTYVEPILSDWLEMVDGLVGRKLAGGRGRGEERRMGDFGCRRFSFDGSWSGATQKIAVKF